MLFCHQAPSPTPGNYWSVLCLMDLPFLGCFISGSYIVWPLESGFFYFSWTSQVALVVKNPPANAGDIGDPGSIPGSGRSPGGANDNPLRYSCLENSMDRGAWWATVYMVAKSQTSLSTFFHLTKSIWDSLPCCVHPLTTGQCGWSSMAVSLDIPQVILFDPSTSWVDSFQLFTIVNKSCYKHSCTCFSFFFIYFY